MRQQSARIVMLVKLTPQVQPFGLAVGNGWIGSVARRLTVDEAFDQLRPAVVDCQPLLDRAMQTVVAGAEQPVFANGAA